MRLQPNNQPTPAFRCNKTQPNGAPHASHAEPATRDLQWLKLAGAVWHFCPHLLTLAETQTSADPSR
eukprot:11224604-Lingulodinium_polyedra.AAC.1